MFRAHRPILRTVHTAVHTLIGSVSVLLWPCALSVVLCTLYRAHGQSSTDAEPMVDVKSCVNSPEDGPVGPKHVEIQQYRNKIEIVTSVDFYSIYFRLLPQRSYSPHSCGWYTAYDGSYLPISGQPVCPKSQ